jgi:2-polyprenyl-3-methyl-5-hydroxy-6-metoxy-1,4-benzoquinol methylase
LPRPGGVPEIGGLSIPMHSTASAPSPAATCRFCRGTLHSVVDLGMSPLCESFLAADEINAMEPFYPLHLKVCADCLLAQIEEYVRPAEIFTEYAYFSAFSSAWLQHASDYVDAMTVRLGLGPSSRVVELASNDGYLLQYFVAKGIPALGIDPAANVAKAAEARGVETLVAFFDQETARQVREERGGADLILGNNVLAQVPDINSFVAGIAILLKAQGVATIEFPHLMRLMQENQFDTIYHEHFSYFSALTAQRIFAAHGLRLFDVEELWTHGGSLRLFLAHDGDTSHPTLPSVGALLAREAAAGLDGLAAYGAFAEQVRETKRRVLDFLIGAKREGKSVVGYGAPGKGNTLLNYCGIRTDFIDYTVDRNPYKHGRYLPGTHIPIFAPERIRETKPDYLFILPWNLKDEIMQQMAEIRDWGGKFVVPIPVATVYP